jgi:lipid-binding SYLF domain-containing protein
MKKFLPLLILALVGTGADVARATPDRANLVSEVQSCYAILQEFMSNPATAIPPQVWQRTQAIIICNQFKAGFIFGVKGGYGVLLVKKPGGHWSLPILLTANEASLGIQLGAKSVETIFVITDSQTPKLLFSHRFNIGVDAKAVIGPKAADTESDNHPILSAPVLVYSKEAGLYAGATVKAAEVGRNDDANYALYNTNFTLPELAYSDWVQPPAELQSFINYVQHLSP